MIYAFLDFINHEKKIELFKKGKKLPIIEYPKTFIICTTIVGILMLGTVVVNFICSPLFNAKSYQQRIIVDETGNFTEDFEPVAGKLSSPGRRGSPGRGGPQPPLFGVATPGAARLRLDHILTWPGQRVPGTPRGNPRLLRALPPLSVVPTGLPHSR